MPWEAAVFSERLGGVCRAERSRHDEYGAGHAEARVRLTIIREGARGGHREVLRRARVGHRNKGTGRIRGLHAGNDDTAFIRVRDEVTIEGQDGIHFDFDAFRIVREVSVRERDGRSHGDRVIRGIGRGAAIHVGFANIGMADGALAFCVVGARGAVAFCTGAAAIDARFRAILNAVVTCRRGAFHHRIAITAHAVGIAHAALTIHAIGRARSAAIDVCFAAILRHIGA